MRRSERPGEGNRNGSNLSTVLSIMEMCWGDVGLLLALPNQGLGNSAIASVADDEQRERFAGKWAAMAITEPEAGSDSARDPHDRALDGDEYVLDGEKIYVTSGERADLVVVWATLDKSKGRAAIKSFVVERANPGMILERVEKKLGIRASDTAAFRLENCRVPKENLLGSPEIEGKRSFAGAMQTFDNTRPLVAAMAVGLTRACLDETSACSRTRASTVDWDRPARSAAAAELVAMEADYEAARLLTLEAAWMADNAKPNSLEASKAKAKAGRTCVDVSQRCVGCRRARLHRADAAGEVGPRREDPRHLRGHAADPAARHRAPAARQAQLGAAALSKPGGCDVTPHPPCRSAAVHRARERARRAVVEEGLARERPRAARCLDRFCKRERTQTAAPGVAVGTGCGSSARRRRACDAAARGPTYGSSADSVRSGSSVGSSASRPRAIRR